MYFAYMNELGTVLKVRKQSRPTANSNVDWQHSAATAAATYQALVWPTQLSPPAHDRPASTVSPSSYQHNRQRTTRDSQTLSVARSTTTAAGSSDHQHRWLLIVNNTTKNLPQPAVI